MTLRLWVPFFMLYLFFSNMLAASAINITAAVKFLDGRLGGVFYWKKVCRKIGIAYFQQKILYIELIWSNYSDLTRPHPKWWFSKGNPLISGKSRLVKYYSIWPEMVDLSVADVCLFQKIASSILARVSFQRCGRDSGSNNISFSHPKNPTKWGSLWTWAWEW